MLHWEMLINKSIKYALKHVVRKLSNASGPIMFIKNKLHQTCWRKTEENFLDRNKNVLALGRICLDYC